MNFNAQMETAFKIPINVMGTITVVIIQMNKIVLNLFLFYAVEKSLLVQMETAFRIPGDVMIMMTVETTQMNKIV